MLEGDGEQDQNKGGEDDEQFSRKIPDTKNRKILEKKYFINYNKVYPGSGVHDLLLNLFLGRR